MLKSTEYKTCIVYVRAGPGGGLFGGGGRLVFAVGRSASVGAAGSVAGTPRSVGAAGPVGRSAMGAPMARGSSPSRRSAPVGRLASRRPFLRYVWDGLLRGWDQLRVVGALESPHRLSRGLTGGRLSCGSCIRRGWVVGHFQSNFSLFVSCFVKTSAENHVVFEITTSL